MSLKADIDNFIAQSSERIPPEIRSLMAADTEQLKESGVWVYGLSGDADGKPVYAEDLTGSIALVIGAEG